MANKSVDIVLDKIINKIESEKVLPWHKPWSTSSDFSSKLHFNVVSGHIYTGTNQLVCWASDFSNPAWITHIEIKKRGLRIKKGSKASAILIYRPYEKKKKDKDGKETDDIKKFFYAKYVNIFNLDQLEEGYEELIPELKKYQKPDNKDEKIFSPIDRAEAVDKKYYVKVNHGGDRAFYRLSQDFIVMPKFKDFDSAEDYYATKFHEYVHSTGHKNRLNRKGVVDCTYFGSPSYSEEELVAEIGAASLCAEVGIDNIINNSASYVNGWLKKLKSDKKILLRAASQSQKAVDYIMKREKKEKSK